METGRVKAPTEGSGGGATNPKTWRYTMENILTFDLATRQQPHTILTISPWQNQTNTAHFL